MANFPSHKPARWGSVETYIIQDVGVEVKRAAQEVLMVRVRLV